MAKTSALRHTHRYIKTHPNTRRTEAIWRCALAGCSHFIPLNTTVIGRSSICWECGQPFTMEERHTKMELPKCDTCVTGVITDADIDAYMNELKKRPKVSQPEKDEVEVIEEEEIHEWNCDIHNGGECTCK